MVQQLRKSITVLAFLVLAGSALGQAPSRPLTLKPDAPDRYVVVPGDTLWGISERFTDSPWRWPELWNLNREQIRNPHLIFPGDVILVDRLRGRLTIAGREPPMVKIGPRARAEAIAREAIPSIPASVIEPFLTRPLVVEPEGLEKAPTIVATQFERVMVSAGNEAYVRGLKDATEPGWFVYRRGHPLVDPDTNQTLGYEAIYLGDARITRPGDPATVLLTVAKQEIGTGDKLLPAGRIEPVNYAPHAPAVHIRGRIMSIYGGLGKVGEAGQHSIITINRGRGDGIELGHVLALYNRGALVRDTSKPRGDPEAMIQLPDERAGLAFVFRVFERVSYALVMHVTRPVNPLDVVQTP
jgi:hypothetical protein